MTYCLKGPKALLNWLDEPLLEYFIFSNFKKTLEASDPSTLAILVAWLTT